MNLTAPPTPTTAVHVANPDLHYDVVAMAATNIRYGGIPAVLRAGPKDWASGELVWEDGHWVAIAVNGYADHTDAWMNAEARE